MEGRVRQREKTDRGKLRQREQTDRGNAKAKGAG